MPHPPAPQPAARNVPRSGKSEKRKWTWRPEQGASASSAAPAASATATAPSAAVTSAAAPVPPNVPAPTHAPNQTAPTPSSAQFHGGPYQRGGRRQHGPRMSRATQPTITEPNANPSLATSTAPSQPSASPAPPKPSPRPRNDSGLHSDMAEDMIQKLESNGYECAICSDVIRAAHPIWACTTCFHVFHHKCIGTWRSTSLNETTRTWRCPGCRAEQHGDALEESTCFCGQHPHPPPSRAHVPHSCGDVCNRPLARFTLGHTGPSSCPHHCTMQCHPGPCPPCGALAPMQSCYCGRTQYRPRCGDDSGQSCGQRCDKLLSCGQHRCQTPCHPGPCKACEHREEAICFCGQTRREMPCGTALTGFGCGSPCPKLMSCGNHPCPRLCHEGPCPVCPTDVTVIATCPCGKTPLPTPRTSCLDPIPTCTNKCGRLGECGHPCQALCHTGPCPPCLVPVTAACRCGSTTHETTCGEVAAAHRQWEDVRQAFAAGPVRTPTPPAREEAAAPAAGPARSPTPPAREGADQATATATATATEPSPAATPSSSRKTPQQQQNLLLCNRVCHALRSCGRHRCERKCCELLHEPQNKTGVHECPLPCGRLLNCKKHRCPYPCHPGPCLPCQHISYDEYVCPCGKTHLDPPIFCHTQLPECPHQCSFPRPCGHPAYHTCHSRDSPCPPCMTLVNRMCVGGHTMVYNVPCHCANPGCGSFCEKLLPCGVHKCTRPCHGGPCLKEIPGSLEPPTCSQLCGKPLSLCGHTCNARCHGRAPCPDKPCDQRIVIRCVCGHRTAEAPCLTCSSAPTAFSRTLDCDETCAQLARNRRLAEALGLSLDRIQCSKESQYSPGLLAYVRREPEFVASLERQFRALVEGRAVASPPRAASPSRESPAPRPSPVETTPRLPRLLPLRARPPRHRPRSPCRP
eukprot:GAFH01000739.1.p1 GENE.GAFH01000739.1~~GAFH01000739.1.p1  ORF type:complete len:944 (-),score=111.94 GAFH01000739.1:798-3548(-)